MINMQTFNEESVEHRNTVLLPIEYIPSRLASLRGYKHFILHPEYIELFIKNKPQKIMFNQVTDLKVTGKRLVVKTDGKSYTIRLDSAHEQLPDIVKSLKDEIDLFDSFIEKINTAQSDTDDFFNIFCTCLNFIGLPFKRAAELLLAISHKLQLSDIHFEPAKSSVKVSFRKSAQLHHACEIPKDRYVGLLARFKHLASCCLYGKYEEGAFGYKDADVRLSSCPTCTGERLSLRFIRMISFPDIKSLGWNESMIGLWKKALNSSRGLYILSGPVGSGKTTAMYATLSEMSLDSSCSRVVTIEDPVEALIPGICQSPLEAFENQDLADAFKRLLRQDPDIVAIGEIRDSSTLLAALQAGLAGHLVLATFHAGSADEAIDRIKNIISAEQQILSALKGILQMNLINKNSKLVADVSFHRFNRNN